MVRVAFVVALALVGAQRVVEVGSAGLSAATEALLESQTSEQLPRVSSLVESDLAPILAFREKAVELVLPRTRATRGFGVGSLSVEKSETGRFREEAIPSQRAVSTVRLGGSACQLFEQTTEFSEKSLFYSQTSTFNWDRHPLEHDGELYFQLDDQLLVHRFKAESETTYKLNVETKPEQFGFMGDFLVVKTSEGVVFLQKTAEQWAESMRVGVRDSATAQVHLVGDRAVYFSADNLLKVVDRVSLETEASLALGGHALDSLVHEGVVFVAVEGRGLLSFRLPSLDPAELEYANPHVSSLSLFNSQGTTFLECFTSRGPEVLVEFGLERGVFVNRVVVWSETEVSHTSDSVFNYFASADKVVFLQRGLSGQARTQVYSLHTSCSPECRLLKVRVESEFALVTVGNGKGTLLSGLRVSAERLKCVFAEEGAFRVGVSVVGDDCSSAEERRVCEEKIVVEFKVEPEFGGSNRLLKVGVGVLVVVIAFILIIYILTATRCCLDNPWATVRSNKVVDVGELVGSSENSSRNSNRV